MANRLIESTSPYLLQHANNPVDWYPWGEEAIARARAEQKPIFLSIGYAACHWCHVMEHQVFERADIAALMNREFINIKVDREERPDLDDLYMLATQLMTGQGGWPMSVWLTPELTPFYAGTYFPPEDGYGRPGFPRLLLALSDAWKNKRASLLEQAKRVVEAIRVQADESQDANDESQKTRDETDAFPVAAWVQLAVEQSADRFDDVHGGLGGSPKFPPHQQLQLWLALVTDDRASGLLSPADRDALIERITKTLDGMMNGGMYDHVGGGFARYSTDAEWLVPHFEKMLYDNAQLAPIYAAASVAFNRPEYARVARETLDFFIREMMSADGAFYSSLDADSEGEEGKYYVWTPDDIFAAVPDPTEAAAVTAYFGITAEGNWHESPVPRASVLAADQRNRTPAVDAALLKMRAHRAHRERPRLDDKILTAWNGLMLSALSIVGKSLGDTPYLKAAERLADFLLSHHRAQGRLLRVSRGGPAHTDAFLDDHAFLLNGLLDLHAARAATPASTMDAPSALAKALIEQFQDQQHGGFFFTGPHHEQLFTRMKNAADNATPSPNGVAIRALLRLANITATHDIRDVATRAVGAFHTNIARRPEYFPTILLGLVEAGIKGDATQSPPVPTPSADRTIRFTAARVDARETADQKVAFDVIFRVVVAPGFHIQPADRAEKGMTQTTARLRHLDGAPIDAIDWHYPPASAEGYTGSFELRAQVTLADPKPGIHNFRATLIAQACAETYCQEPATLTADFTIDLS